MGKFKLHGDSALALAEEAAEVIQIITKKQRFDGDWDDVPPEKTTTRWQQLESEMEDLLFQWERLKTQYKAQVQQAKYVKFNMKWSESYAENEANKMFEEDIINEYEEEEDDYGW